jgi:hypothetical protein
VISTGRLYGGEVFHVPYGDADAVERQLAICAKVGIGVAGVIMEPIQVLLTIHYSLYAVCYFWILVDLRFAHMQKQFSHSIIRSFESLSRNSVVQGEAGAIEPPEDFWPRIRESTRKYSTLLIADEVQTGNPRTQRRERRAKRRERTAHSAQSAQSAQRTAHRAHRAHRAHSAQRTAQRAQRAHSAQHSAQHSAELS